MRVHFLICQEDIAKECKQLLFIIINIDFSQISQGEDVDEIEFIDWEKVHQLLEMIDPKLATAVINSCD